VPTCARESKSNFQGKEIEELIATIIFGNGLHQVRTSFCNFFSLWASFFKFLILL